MFSPTAARAGGTWLMSDSRAEPHISGCVVWSILSCVKWHLQLKQECQGPYLVCILTGHTCIYGRLAAEEGSLQSRTAWLGFLMSPC